MYRVSDEFYHSSMTLNEIAEKAASTFVNPAVATEAIREFRRLLVENDYVIYQP